MKQQPVAAVADGAVGHPSPEQKRPRINLSRNGPYLVTVDDLTPDGHANCPTCGHSKCSAWPPVFEALIPASS
jgi:hypothetical protein